jgi:septum formation protein
MLYVAFHAPHTPNHLPPAQLTPVTPAPTGECRFDPGGCYRMMVEALDTELGRLLGSMDPGLASRTTVILVSDNGTPVEAISPPWPALHSKGTIFEGGIRVPLIIRSPLVVQPGREVPALVNTTDLFATVAELAGKTKTERAAVIGKEIARLAREKGLTAAPQAGVILAADTVVCIDGEVLGKPRDREHALAMLTRLSGSEHEVITAVAVIAGDALFEARSSTRVWFRDLSADECIEYWDTGEPRDKAGAYAIQGRAAAFITRIEGSYSGVVGLPLYEASTLLARAGIRTPIAAGQLG